MIAARDVPEAVGRTPLIRLRHATEITGCEIWGKAEFMNPGQSVKDRAALFILRDAVARGVLRPGGTVLFICPQERGYASDKTHVRFTTGTDLAALAEGTGLTVQKSYSFPFPRWTGRLFTYNEFCVVARKPAGVQVTR